MKRRNSPFTDLIINKDQSIIHLLINYLKPKDLRNLRGTSKTIEGILINNTTFIIKAMWNPIAKLATAERGHQQVYQYQEATKKLIPKELGHRKFLRALLQFNPLLRLRGGAATEITAYAITKLDTNKDIYEYTRRRLRDLIIVEQKTKMTLYTNGYKSTDSILTEMEKTSDLVHEIQLKIIQASSKARDLVSWTNKRTQSTTLFEPLVNINKQLFKAMAITETQENYESKASDYFNYTREPTKGRFMAIYCTGYLNNLLIEIKEILETRLKEECNTPQYPYVFIWIKEDSPRKQNHKENKYLI